MSLFYVKMYNHLGEGTDSMFSGLREAKESVLFLDDPHKTEAVIYCKTKTGIKLKWIKKPDLPYWEKIK
jgi:hypothetical protein